jgi:hypothetical protein
MRGPGSAVTACQASGARFRGSAPRPNRRHVRRGAKRRAEASPWSHRDPPRRNTGGTTRQGGSRPRRHMPRPSRGRIVDAACLRARSRLGPATGMRARRRSTCPCATFDQMASVRPGAGDARRSSARPAEFGCGARPGTVSLVILGPGDARLADRRLSLGSWEHSRARLRGESQPTMDAVCSLQSFDKSRDMHTSAANRHEGSSARSSSDTCGIVSRRFTTTLT